MNFRTLQLVVILGALLLAVSDLSAQYILESGSASVGPGGTAEVPVLLDSTNGDLLAGWSFGVCHDETELNLTGVLAGATTATSNLGQPPEFEELIPLADGFVQAVVICFTFCSSLPQGSGHELARATYQALGPVGTNTTLNICGSLGAPPFAILVVDEIGSEIVPTTLDGTVSVVDVDISDLQCAVTGSPCSCGYDLSWVNGGVYDEIEVSIDGVLTQVLAGGATQTLVPELNVPPGGAALRQVCVTPMIGGVPGTSACCNLSCTIDEPPSGGVLVATPVVPAGGGCEAELSWSGFTAQSAFTATVTIDGILAQSGITASALTVTLPSGGAHEVCVSITDGCGLVSAEICEFVQCVTQVFGFVRSDSNLDGTTNVADGIFTLDVLFVGTQTHFCLDGADSNDDGMVDISDVIFTFGYLFTQGAPPPPPGLGCGPDPTTTDPLDCASSTLCP